MFLAFLVAIANTEAAFTSAGHRTTSKPCPLVDDTHGIGRLRSSRQKRIVFDPQGNHHPGSASFTEFQETTSDFQPGIPLEDIPGLGKVRALVEELQSENSHRFARVPTFAKISEDFPSTADARTRALEFETRRKTTPLRGHDGPSRVEDDSLSLVDFP